jgi:epoxyqueuosine reductase QueG
VRNAAVVAGNAKDESARATLEGAAAQDPSETVRDAAQWALDHLSPPAHTSPRKK